MIKKLLPGLILILSCNSNNDNSSNNEKISDDNSSQPIIEGTDYIKTRDNYIKYFNSIDFDKIDWSNSNDSVLVKEKEARLDLEIKLKNLIEFSKANDFKDSEINLFTLFHDYGFGLMDGLIFKNESLKVYCTTSEIFQNFFQNEKFTDFDMLNLKELEQILNKVFYYDARISVFYMYNQLKGSGYATYGLLGSISQDLLFEPYFVYTLSLKNGQIYITEQKLSIKIDRIALCNSLMDSIISKSTGTIERYCKTGEIDSIILNNSMKLEDFAYSKYCDCFNKEFPKSPQIENVKKQIEEVTNYINQ